MSYLGKNPENQFEVLKQRVEGLSGGIEIMHFRLYGNIRQSISKVETSPTIIRALENARRAQADADALAYKQEVERIAQEAQVASTVAASDAQPLPVSQPEFNTEAAALEAHYAMPPNSELTDQEKMVAQARAKTNEIHGIDSHERPLAA